MSAGWQAFFWALALVCFTVRAAGVLVTWRKVQVELLAAGLVFFTIPWFWSALQAA